MLFDDAGGGWRLSKGVSMANTVRVPYQGSAEVHNLLASADEIDISKISNFCVFLPVGFTADLTIWSRGNGTDWGNTGIVIAAPGGYNTAEIKAITVDATIFPHQYIKLISAAGDATKTVFWRGKA